MQIIKLKVIVTEKIQFRKSQAAFLVFLFLCPSIIGNASAEQSTGEYTSSFYARVKEINISKGNNTTSSFTLDIILVTSSDERDEIHRGKEITISGEDVEDFKKGDIVKVTILHIVWDSRWPGFYFLVDAKKTIHPYAIIGIIATIVGTGIFVAYSFRKKRKLHEEYVGKYEETSPPHKCTPT